MNKKMLFKIFIALLFIVLFMCSSWSVFALEIPECPRTDIVYLYDASGSVANADTKSYAKDALRLGFDLSPSDARISVISFNDHILSEFPLSNMSQSKERSSAKSMLSSQKANGNTDFLPSFERATEILSASEAEKKWIVLLGDFQEGGYNLSESSDRKSAQIQDLTKNMVDNGIEVHSIFYGLTPEKSKITSAYMEMPEKTGGTLHQIKNPSQIPAVIEKLYFDAFPYFQTAYTFRGENSQTLQIKLPAAYAKRARVYVSATHPMKAFNAIYGGGSLDGETTKSYAVVDVTNPVRDEISVSLTPGKTGTAIVYLLLDYDVELSVTSNYIAKMNEKNESIQETQLDVRMVDAQTKEPLFTDLSSEMSYSVTITQPDGTPVVEMEQDQQGACTFLLVDEEDFGAYQVNATLVSGDFEFSPATVTMPIPDIRPIPDPINWPLIIALTMVCLFILLALMIALRIKKREAEFQGAVEMSSDYRFYGKLSIYSVMLEAGQRELRPFDFRLNILNEKRVTLRSILDSICETDIYQGAENILFLVGPEESIVIRNNSNATIRVMGRTYGHRTTTQLFYDQKCYIVFDKDENELEVKYCRVKLKEEDRAPVRFTTRSHQRYTS